MNYDRIVREWFYRLPKGYAEAPYSDAELKVLDEVINEQETSLTEAEGADYFDILIRDANLDESLARQVVNIYDKLSASEKKAFDENFRQHTVESFVESGWKPFVKFYNIAFQEKVAGGIGRGEVQILLGVKDSETGGTGKHDIVLAQGGEWEVKELDKQAFRPAKAGLAFKFALTTMIKEFYDNVVFTYTQMDEARSNLKDMVDPSARENLDKILDIIENNFARIGDTQKINAAGEWNQGDFDQWYNGFVELNGLMSKLDVDIRDTRIIVKSGQSKTAYWISAEDADKIAKNAEEDGNISIDVGNRIDRESVDSKIWFKYLQDYIFVKDPDEFINKIREPRTKFFDGVLGLIFFRKKESNARPYIGLPDDFAIYAVSQGQYRFRHRDHSSVSKYEYQKRQL